MLHCTFIFMCTLLYLCTLQFLCNPFSKWVLYCTCELYWSVHFTVPVYLLYCTYIIYSTWVLYCSCLLYCTCVLSVTCFTLHLYFTVLVYFSVPLYFLYLFTLLYLLTFLCTVLYFNLSAPVFFTLNLPVCVHVCDGYVNCMLPGREAWDEHPDICGQHRQYVRPHNISGHREEEREREMRGGERIKTPIYCHLFEQLKYPKMVSTVALPRKYFALIHFLFL